MSSLQYTAGKLKEQPHENAPLVVEIDDDPIVTEVGCLRHKA